MKKSKKNKRHSTKKGRSRASIRGVGRGSGIGMETLAAVAAGGVVSKALNGITKNIPAVRNNKVVLPAAKIGGGYYLASNQRGFLGDMGYGFIVEGVLDLMERNAPNVFQRLASGVAGIGATTIDLDDAVSGSSPYVLEQDYGVAGDYEDIALGAAV